MGICATKIDPIDSNSACKPGKGLNGDNGGRRVLGNLLDLKKARSVPILSLAGNQLYARRMKEGGTSNSENTLADQTTAL